MEFSIACSEVYYLFTNLKETELKKIPSKLVELICILKIDDYIPKININKPLEEQELSQATKELICLIYNKYLGTEEEKNNYNKKYNECVKIQSSKENISFMFNKRKEQIKEEKLLIEYQEKTSIFSKILKKIKEILKIK